MLVISFKNYIQISLAIIVSIMFKNTTVYKFLFRWLVVNVIFFLVKITMEREGSNGYSFFNSEDIYYYCTTFFLIMVTWEHNDWLLRRELKIGGLDLKSNLRILGLSLAVLLFFSTIFYYVAAYPLAGYIKESTEEPFVCFLRDMLRASLLGFAIISFNLFYYAMRQRDIMKKQLDDMKREMLASKYVSLKNQISPHFLFNSLNTLTSLMYEDRDLASDFLARLASSYRYILDTTEVDIVPLKKEFNFLDSYIFMMNVRHEGALKIKVEMPINLDTFFVPTLSLQMLVENALKHNYFSKEKPLTIHIYTKNDTDIVVENTVSKRVVIEDSTKLGLENIKKRYLFYTKNKVIVSTNANCFLVTMPLLKKGCLIKKDYNFF